MEDLFPTQRNPSLSPRSKGRLDDQPDDFDLFLRRQIWAVLSDLTSRDAGAYPVSHAPGPRKPSLAELESRRG